MDALSNALRFTLTGGETHDLTQADALIDGLGSEYVIADRGYDAYAFRRRIEERGSIPVMPSGRNRKREIE